jgi:hypothetical protein
MIERAAALARRVSSRQAGRRARWAFYRGVLADQYGLFDEAIAAYDAALVAAEKRATSCPPRRS